jgi:hypothetical protein
MNSILNNEINSIDTVEDLKVNVNQILGIPC